MPPSAKSDPADTHVPTKPQTDNPPAEQELVEEAPLEAAGERAEPTPTFIKTPKAATRHQPAAKKAANANKASELVPGALRNV